MTNNQMPPPKPDARAKRRPSADQAAPAKLPRGRPVGSSSLEAKDASALSDLAMRMAEEPTAVPTEIFRDLGFNKQSDLTRLRRKWADRKVDLLDQAKREKDARAELGILGQFSSFLSGLAEPVGNLAMALWQGPLGIEIRAGVKDFEQGAQSHQANTELGNTKPPFEFPPDLLAAEKIRQDFEDREYRDENDLFAAIAPDLTMDDLPAWLINYSWALIFYQISLDQRTKAERNGTTGLKENSTADGQSDAASSESPEILTNSGKGRAS